MPDSERIPTVIVVGGPTASGKTRAAALLARHFNTEVVSADSRQFYGALHIGTAIPEPEELLGVKHHFIGHLPVEASLSAGEYERKALPVLQEILDRHGCAVVVGGSGLYVDALCHGLDALPPSDERVRRSLEEKAAREGLAPLLARLEELDPETFARMDRQNPRRVLRALEVCLVTGKPYSALRTGQHVREGMQLVKIAMNVDRETLYGRIEARVDAMVERGLVEEAKSMLPKRHHNALLTVGYRELFVHFDGKLGLHAAISLIKQHTRNYAKRQLTWLRRDPDWVWIPPDDIDAMIKTVHERMAGAT